MMLALPRSPTSFKASLLVTHTEVIVNTRHKTNLFGAVGVHETEIPPDGTCINCRTLYMYYIFCLCLGSHILRHAVCTTIVLMADLVGPSTVEQWMNNFARARA